MLLKFDVTKNSIICINPQAPKEEDVIVYVKCRFYFKTAIWSDMEAVVAVFKSASYDTVAECVLDSSGCCYMPPEIYKHGGVVQVVLYGDQYTADQKRLTSDYIGPANVFFGRNVVLPVPLPSKYDVFVAEFTNIKHGLDASIITLERLITDYKDISEAYIDAEYHLVIVFNTGEQYRSLVSLQGPQGDPGPKGDPGPSGETTAATTQQIIDIVNG